MRSIATERPELVDEWHPTKNGELTPGSISFGSVKKVWWRCARGHEWEASPNNRSKGQGCPYCSGRRALVGFNDLATVEPDIAATWHPAKNGDLTPDQVTRGSHKKVWWICERGHEWEASVFNRTKGRGCPACASLNKGKRRSEAALRKNGSLAEKFPELLQDWDYELNEAQPSEISCLSNLRSRWVCHVCGHRWTASVYKRTAENHTCPVCARKVVKPGFNDLQFNRPDIALEWASSLNGNLKPSDVTVGSNKKVWWQCDKGHTWLAEVSQRTSGAGCPYCSNQMVWPGYNDLATTNPVIASEWHPAKNGNLKPTDIAAGSSRKKVWWLCPFGHEYQATPANHSIGTGCPVCAKEGKTSFPEQALYFYFSKITPAFNRYQYDGKYEVDVWLPELNAGIEYDGAFWHASLAVKEREKKKDQFFIERDIKLIRIKEVKRAEDVLEDFETTLYCQSSINGSQIPNVIARISRLLGLAEVPDVDIERDRIAIYSQYVSGQKANSLSATNPDLAREWHPTKNGILTPEMISRSSGKKVWWLCEKGHEWQSSVDNRSRGNGCPYCAGVKLLVGFSDLATTNPEIAAEWHPTKNAPLTPRDVTRGSTKRKPWWVCPNGHEYRATVSNRTLGKGCPICSKVKRGKAKHVTHLLTHDSLDVTHPELCKEWDFERNGIILPSDVTNGADTKVWWICDRGHHYQATVANRVYGKGCSYCAGKKVLEGFNDLASAAPEIASQWHPTKNGHKKPNEVVAGSHAKAWWLCEKGHEWEAQIKSRVKQGVGCPYCSNKRCLKGYNDLASRYPDLLAEWDWEKNVDLKPDEIVCGSGKKAWWKCSEGHSWQAPIYRRAEGRGCPICRHEHRKSDSR